jgi:diaminopimelate decarboxylase/aspartate kinase
MTDRFIVLKFGGSSVSEARHWRTIERVVRDRMDSGFRPVLVLSALKNVTNLLEGLLHQARVGAHHHAVGHLRDMHYAFASELGLEGERLLTMWFSELESVLSEIEARRNITPKLHARVLATGELLSSTLGAAYMNKVGLSCRWMDIRRILKSEPASDPWHAYVSATCNFEVDGTLQQRLAEEKSLLVTQGFIASNEDGETVLLGREGSDTTAAYLAAMLNARKVEIWTDVPGIFSANPRDLPEARQLMRLGYEEAQRLTQSGAKVLHERALKPLASRNIPAEIRCTWLPDMPGTIVGSDDFMTAPFAVSQIAPVTWFRFSERELAPRRGILPALMGKGYDLVVDALRPAGGEMVLYWANSDAPEPGLSELLAAGQADDTGIEQHLACLGVVGPRDNHWHEILDAFVERSERALGGGVRQIMHLPGRWVLLVEQRLAHDWLRQLHTEVMRTSSAVSHGRTWQEIHEVRS